MNHLLIDGDATVSRKPVIPKKECFAAEIKNAVTDCVIDLLGRHTRFNHRCNFLKGACDHLTGLGHQIDLTCGFVLYQSQPA